MTYDTRPLPPLPKGSIAQPDASVRFREANQRYLVAALTLLGKLFDAADEPDIATARRGVEQARLAMPSPPAIDLLAKAYDLTPFERDLLLMCAGVEVDSAFASRCAAAQEDPRSIHPTFSLALAVLPDAHWTALGPRAPLRRFYLLSVGPGESLTRSPLRIEERILHYIIGVDQIDDLDGLAQRMDPAATWDDLVLPDATQQALRDIASSMRHQTKVHETWGFAGNGERGLGVSVLFAGASGTGKTMAAEVLANDLQRDLYRLDISRIVSKYVGETEKNLSQIFDAAERSCAMLLFDEADALFGRRGEVRESMDRYANLQTAYLLQRMEAFRGLAILTTNLEQAIDPAFLRRLRFVVRFPLPGLAERAAIWARAFPRQTPTEGLDLEQLAKMRLTGGSIRNVALRAAFLAAEGNTPVCMRHVMKAAHAEYEKLGRTATIAFAERDQIGLDT